MGGGGKSEAKESQELGYASSWEAARQSKELFGQTEPLRSSFMDEWGKLEAGEMPFGSAYNSMFSAARNPIEQQYGRARENIIATNPTGGKMFENLANIETEKANTLGNITAGYLMDILNKGYGAAWQTPQITIGGLNTAGQVQMGAAQSFGQGASNVGGSAMSGCCFNFLEAEGEIYSTVRRYRDEHYLRDGKVSIGYIRTAMTFVPLMKRFGWFKQLIRILMTKPLKTYSKWYYGENKFGFVFYPFKLFWVNSWRILGVR